MRFKSSDKLLEFLGKRYVIEIGSGSQGVCYLNKNNRKVYKIFHQFFDFYLADFCVSYSKDEIMKFDGIINDSFVFPEDVICVGEEVVGYVSNYVNSRSLYEVNPLFISLDDFCDSLGVIGKDIECISNFGVMSFDVMYNVLYGKGGFKVIDTLDYSFSSLDSKELLRINSENFNSEIFYFLIDGFFDNFVSNDSMLSEMYDGKDVDIILFVSLLRKKLSEYIGRDIVKLFDARCVVDEGVNRSKRYVRRLGEGSNGK